MTGPRTDRTRWLRDQILAAVRENPGSTTQELVDQDDDDLEAIAALPCIEPSRGEPT